MTRRTTPSLRVAPPTLEPGPVLLHQLAELGACSSPSARTARRAGVRALAGAATVAVIGGTTWMAGAATGPDLGAGRAERFVHVTTSAASPGGNVVGTPQTDDSTSAPGSPWSPGLPGTGPSSEARTDHQPVRPDHPRGRSGQHAHPGNPHQEGRHDNGQHRGHAYGHDKTPPGRGRHSSGSHEGRHGNDEHEGRHDNGRHHGAGNGHHAKKGHQARDRRHH